MLVEVKPEAKKPFLPVHKMALDSKDVKQNFMYMLRILLNSHNRDISNSENQHQFVETLVHEIKIKKGLMEPEVAVRTSALNSIRRKK